MAFELLNSIRAWYAQPHLPEIAGSDRMQRVINFWGSYVVFAFFTTITLIPLAGAFYWLHVELESLYPDGSTTPSVQALVHLPREFAIACAIAWALGFSVEYINRRRHRTQAIILEEQLEKQRSTMIRDLKENTFRAIYERTVPANVFEEILKHLLLCKFYRRSYHIEIVLRRTKTERGELGDRARITIRHNFEVVNVSSTKCVYPGEIFIDKRTVGQGDEAQPSHFQSLHSETRDSTGVLLKKGDFDRAKLKKEGIVSDDASHPAMEVLRYPLTLQPQYSALIDVTYVQYHPLDGADAFCCIHPADGLDIRVTIPDNDFQVAVMSMHPTDAVDNSSASITESKHFVIPGGLFPGQGIYYRWWPAKAPTEVLAKTCTEGLGKPPAQTLAKAATGGGGPTKPTTEAQAGQERA